MKNITLVLLLLFAISACKNNDDNPIDCNLPEVVGFKNYDVDFYSTHKDFVIHPATFEMVTEQALRKPAHLAGAIFQTTNEQYLSKESFKHHQILDSMNIHLVVNSETDSIAEVTCYNFFTEANIVEVEVPAEYKTRMVYQLTQEGTGQQVPATYHVLTSSYVVTDSEVIPTTEAQKFKRIEFRIPSDRTIRAYLANQFGQQSIVDCEEGNSFFIQE